MRQMTVIIILILKWFFVVLSLLVITGVLYEFWSRWRLEQTAFKDKTFVDINGTKIHYKKKGKGNCTVVFQSGMGSSHAIWEEIQDSIASYAVTISYDRSGLLLSGKTDLPLTNESVTKELEILLQKTNCPKPYILVGHSMAAIYLRPFIHRNKEDVRGVIFAEAAHTKQIKLASPKLLKTLKPPPKWLIKLAVNCGLYRIWFSYFPLSPEIPFNHPLHRTERDFFYRSYQRTLEELQNDFLNFSDAEQYPSLGTIPLTVIMGSSKMRYASIKDPEIQMEYEQLTISLQRDLLTLSSNSKFVEAKNSGHILQIFDKKLLINEIIPLTLL